MYNFVRWTLFLGVWFWAIMAANPYLGGLAFFIAFWPPPEDRQAFFYGPKGILNRDKPKY